MFNVFISEYIKKIRKNNSVLKILSIFNKREIIIFALAILFLIIYVVSSLLKFNKVSLIMFLLSCILTIIFDIVVYYDCRNISTHQISNNYKKENIQHLKDLLKSYDFNKENTINTLIQFCDVKINEKPSFIIYNPIVLLFATLFTSMLSIFSNCFKKIAKELDVSIIDLFIVTILFTIFICGILLMISSIIGKYINRKPYLIQLRDDLLYLTTEYTEK